ncbi:MFS transporter [Paenibacillus sp. CGMCC 1.16610]|uniref:MFS transporter n=1 Tax=Paenibacillus anseongense TaxID=2682845 RepID=A0ABW9U1W6_9BACL|nr:MULTISPECIES: MFS transporter [Paenibacillus]MBA2940890.1 MFS transporter [Paenibacillus sp. CGMCC 1.16610]MVQ34074.1 MFS transporter [Paenibacillus anseongense]
MITTSEDRLRENQRPVTIIAVVTALSLLGDSMLYIVLPIYWREVGLHALWEVGVLLSINRFIRLPMTPLIGLLYKRMSLRTGLILAIVLAAATTIGYSMFKGFIIWLVLRSLWGIAWSFLRMGGYLTVIRYSDDTNRGHLMGRYNGIFRLGSLIGMLVGGVLVPLVGMPIVSIAFGVFMLIGLPYVAVYISGAKANQSDVSLLQKERIDNRAAIWKKPVLKIVATGLFVYLLQTVLSVTLSLQIETNYPQPMTLIGIVVTSTMLSGVLQSARWGWEPFLASWIGLRSDGSKGRLPLFCLTLIISAVGYALIPWQLPIYLWCAIILLVLAASTAVSTLMDALASDVARFSSVVAVMTAYSVATDMGSALGPMLVYLAVSLPNGITYIYLGSALMFLLIALWYRPNVKQKMNVLPSERDLAKTE